LLGILEVIPPQNESQAAGSDFGRIFLPLTDPRLNFCNSFSYNKKSVFGITIMMHMKYEIPELKKLVYEMRIPMRWGDMDAMGHVNNTLYFRYLETVRIEWMRSIGCRPILPAKAR
jgi:Thioesterase-like superfamily